jgi:hypothetical protein
MAFGSFTLNIITFLHILFFIFMVGAPFVNSNYILFLHFILVPFLMLHWICNDNTCALTIAEKAIRKQFSDNVNSSDCVTCLVIEPVYDFRKNNADYTALIYAVAILLWCITAYRLFSRYRSGKLSSFTDLFTI